MLIFVAFLVAIGFASELEAQCSSSLLVEQGAGKKWCWTQIDPTKKVEAEDGAANWGYCYDPLAVKKKYKVIVDSAKQNQDARDKFSIKFKGDKLTSPWVLLSQFGFESNTLFTNTIETTDVGNLLSVRVRSEGKKPYQCRTLTVVDEFKSWVFECDEPILCPKDCFRDFKIRGNQRYEVTVTTSALPNSGDNAAIYIELTGSLGKSTKKMLSEDGFKLGTTVKKTIYSQDIGDLTSIRISSKSVELFRPDKIVISRAGKSQDEFLPKGETISCPSKCSMNLAIALPPKTDGGPAAGAAAAPEVDQNDPVSLDTPTGGDAAQNVLNDYGGGSLNAKEKANMIELSCSQKMKDMEIFGGKTMVNTTNYKMVIAKCPADCHVPVEGSDVFGYGIHPEEASICMSALVDRSIPFHGGVIGINVLTGLKEYEEGPAKTATFDVQAKPHGKSMKSFTTFRIDNIDLVESDIRIVNSIGQLDSFGRVEFRNNGLWGTACSAGMNNYAARTLCRMMKYQDGRLVNTEQNPKVCKNYNNLNHCGPDFQTIYYKNIQCTKDDNEFKNCYKVLANGECTHDQDAIVECVFENYDNSFTPDEGTVRIANYNEQTKGGRLEYFTDGKWGTICNKDFSKAEASVVCQQMGFQSGDILGGTVKPGGVHVCQNYLGQNFCGQDPQPIARKIKGCKGNEHSVKQCQVERVNDCNHKLDAIVICQGSGDPTGKSQKAIVPKQGSTPMGKLPLPPVLQLGCGDNVVDKKAFTGDAGSTFVAQCPKGCKQQPGIIQGTSIYRDDGSICLAAIHSGVIQNEDGGYILVTKKPGLKNYFGSAQRGLNSLFAGASQSGSFSVSKVPNTAFEMVKLFASWKKGKFPDLSSKALSIAAGTKTGVEDANPEVEKQKQKQAAEARKRDQAGFRFMELEGMAVVPPAQFYSNSNTVYNLSPPKEGSTLEFKKKEIQDNSDLILGDRGILSKMTAGSYQISMNALMTNFDGAPATILNFNCWGLKVDPNEQLIFEKRGTQDIFYSDWVMPINEKIVLQLLVNNGKAKDGFNTFTLMANGEVVSKRRVQFDVDCQGQGFKGIQVGVLGETQIEYFSGQLSMIKIFNQILAPDVNARLVLVTSKMLEDGIKPTADAGAQAEQTNDRRYCISKCTTEPLPGTKGAPQPPSAINAISGSKPSSGTGKTDGLLAKDILKEFPNAFAGTGDDKATEKEEPDAAAVSLAMDSKNNVEENCAKTGHDFKGATGKQFKFQCPAGCDKKPGNIVGFMVYYTDSAVCKAAIHSGILTAEGGEVVLEIANGLESYESLMNNGIQSLGFEFGPSSFFFHKDPTQVSQLQCEQTAASEAVAKVAPDQIAYINCPANCTSATGSVFGDKTYSEDSSICMAAIHAGLIGNKGGEVKILIKGQQAKFKGSVKNGITSGDKGSYIRSFEVLGQAVPDIVKPILPGEDITESFATADSAVGDGPKTSEWSFVPNPTDPADECIHQNTLIDNNIDFLWGTQSINKDYEGSTGIVSVGVYLEKLVGKTGIIFHRADDKNFLALEINGEKKGDIRLVKMVEGTGEVLEKANTIISPKVWTSFRIVISTANYVAVYSKLGDKGGNTLLFKHQFESLNRGKVALATSGNDQAFFDDFKVDAFDPTKENPPGKYEHLDFQSCVTDIDTESIKKRCGSHFGGFPAYLSTKYVEECSEKWNFCDMCCDKLVNKAQNVWVYECQRQCVKAVKAAQAADDKANGGAVAKDE